jgi:cytochrome b pre-mRNA-processing protein 3
VPILSSLFRGLTAGRPSGTALFEVLTAEARQPCWYVEGGVPDTLDGRFSVLATVIAMALVRLEHDGAEGNLLSVALTERFIEVMETEHRELGLGDPKLGRTVRKLVGMLGRRTDLWRSAFAGETGWADAVRQSLYRGSEDMAGLEFSAAALERFRERLASISLRSLGQGEIA